MSVKLYQLYCEICNWKRITDGSDIGDLFELKTSPIPGGIPELDPETKKTVIKKSLPRTKKFRCPKCGRGVLPRKIPNPQEEADRKKQELEKQALIKAEQEADKKKWEMRKIELEREKEEKKKDEDWPFTD